MKIFDTWNTIRTSVTGLCLLAGATFLHAQPQSAPKTTVPVPVIENPGNAGRGGRGGQALRSLEVLPDKKVTFRIRAPKATDVTINGDWMAPNTPVKLTKDDQGVWSVTLGPLAPGIAI